MTVTVMMIAGMKMMIRTKKDGDSDDSKQHFIGWIDNLFTHFITIVINVGGNQKFKDYLKFL